MPRRARVHYVSLRTSLVNLPVSLYGPLIERGVRPQALGVHLKKVTEGKPPARGESTHPGEAYLGWTGMVSASSLAQFQAGSGADKGLETIEMDPQLAQGLGFAEGDVVELGMLHDLQYATNVATEPLTADDWEILEIHASHVESTMLSQVRVASVGQEIDVWVLGRTRVRLRVVSVNPSSKGNALLLGPSTEVSIAPKTRGPVPNGKAAPNGTAKSASDIGSKVNGVRASGTAAKTEPGTSTGDAAHRKRRFRYLRNLPTRVLPHYSPTCPALEDGSILAIGYVSKATLKTLAAEPQDTDATPMSWRAKVLRIPPPIDPSAPPSSSPHVPSAVPKVLNPTDPSTAKSGANGVPEKPPEPEVIISWSPEVPIPGGQVVLYGSVPGVEDWDQVRVEFIRETKEEISQTEQVMTPLLSDTSTPKLAGVDSIIDDCKSFCYTTFGIQAFSKRTTGVPGLLVTGRSGAGKTSILRAVSRSLQENPDTLAYTLYADLAKYTDTPVSKVKLLIKYWFDKAAWHFPTVVVLDNLDKLMSKELEHADSFRTRHITELFIEQFGSGKRSASPNARGIVLLASADSSASIHPSLNSAHIFQEVIHLKPPGKDARRDILANIVQSHIDTSDLRQDPDAPLNFTALSTQTEGYSANDLKDLVARAVHRCAMRVAEHVDDKELYEPTLTAEDFTAAQSDFVPLSLRDVKLQKSDIAWSDIGGLHETKQVLRETLEWPTKYGPIFAQSPLRLRSGLLLYGFPGCGKTLLASAVARECGLNFISVKGPELLNKYIGASEQSVRELFERASAAKPCVLFFDEFDSIAPKRGHDSTGVTDRVVNQMLTQMDGAEGLDGVYVLAATSRPDLIDSALLRPGRLDKSLLCNMPDVRERKEILEAVSHKVVLAPDVDFDELTEETDGFSGADLQALVYNAQLEVIHETINAAAVSEDVKGKGKGKGKAKAKEVNDAGEEYIEYKQIGGPETKGIVKSRAEEAAFQRRLRRIIENSQGEKKDETPKGTTHSTVIHQITQEHLRKVLETTRPSVPPQERERLARIYRAFVSDRSGELPVPPDAGGVGHRVTLM